MVMSAHESIPFSSPSITEREIESVLAVLRSKKIGSTEENLAHARQALKLFTEGHDVLLTTSCTSAMELGLRSLELEKKDQWMVPSFTFVSTANVVLASGATPTFIDIEEDTLNIDLNEVEQRMSHAIRGIIPVHYASISCDMNRLIEIAKKQNALVLEDAAHALGARYNNRYLGTMGDFGAFSFHDTKNYVTGEGGALVINTNTYNEKLMTLYEKGTNRQQFLRGEVDKYTWVSEGSSYVLSGILAALLTVQLERFEEIRDARKKRCEQYQKGLQSLVDEGYIRFTKIPEYSTSNYHKAFFLMNDQSRRNALLAHLQSRGIGAVFHYIPLHLSPYAKKHLGTKEGQCPVAERVAESIVRLPLFPHLTEEQCNRIIHEIQLFFHPEYMPQNSVEQKLPTSKNDDTQYFDCSIVVACYNEAPHLHENLDAMIQIMDQMKIRYEIIIIDDLSTDETAERIREYKNLHTNHAIQTIFHTKNMGRGATVTEGIEKARGRIVGFMDIDLEIAASYLPSAIIPLLEGKSDVIIGDRSYVFQCSAWKRYTMSKVYRWLVRNLLQIPSIDTEAGFKFFQRELILPVLKNVKDTHWFWDTEVSVQAYDAGLRVQGIPVLFHRKLNKMSTVKAFHDSKKSLLALIRFARMRKNRNAIHS